MGLQILAICIGASVGALMRWGLGVWLNTSAAALPWGTLTANLIGGYCIGVFIGVFQTYPDLSPTWRLAIVTGFLGALTTFSTFSAEAVGLLQQSRFALAALHSALHLFGSLLATWAGLRTAMLFIRPGV